MHKTGTTSIQGFVSRLEDSRYIQFLKKNKDLDCQKFIDKLSINLDINSEDISQAKKNLAKVQFLSSESLSGVREETYKGTYLKYIPEVLKNVVSKDSTIVITYRDPVKIIASMYVDSVLYGYTLSFDDWWNTIESRGWDSVWRLDKIVNGYRKHFDKIEIYNFDRLLNAKSRTLFELTNSLPLYSDRYDDLKCKDLLERENISPKLLSIKFQRSVVNRLFDTKLKHMSHMGTTDKLRIYKFYRVNINKRLDKFNSLKSATAFYEGYFRKYFMNQIKDRSSKIKEIELDWRII